MIVELEAFNPAASNLSPTLLIRESSASQVISFSFLVLMVRNMRLPGKCYT